MQLISTRLTQAPVFQNFCRDHHETHRTFPRLRTIWLFAHDLLRRHTEKRFHHYNSDCRLTILGRAFTQTGWTALTSRRFLQTSCPQATPFATRAPCKVRIWNTFSMMFELILHWTSPRSNLVGLLLPTTVV